MESYRFSAVLSANLKMGQGSRDGGGQFWRGYLLAAGHFLRAGVRPEQSGLQLFNVEFFSLSGEDFIEGKYFKKQSCSFSPLALHCDYRVLSALLTRRLLSLPAVMAGLRKTLTCKCLWSLEGKSQSSAQSSPPVPFRCQEQPYVWSKVCTTQEMTCSLVSSPLAFPLFLSPLSLCVCVCTHTHARTRDQTWGW